jgi:glycolate oxidase FAD binding subunit
MDRDATSDLASQVRQATADRQPLRIVGGDTKAFYGRRPQGAPLETRGHAGILSHDPAELVITARGGTPLLEVEAQLASHGQRLPFEPPHFGANATLGGTVACGLAGPARAWMGPLSDFVLGARVLTGDGRVLRFGGEVMKNVAGYDVARLMAGSLGILGVLLDVSLKVLPLPAGERTFTLELDEARALERVAELARGALPLSASGWTDGRLYLRFEGSEATLDVVQRTVGGEVVPQSRNFWASLREQTHPFFAGPQPLWRCTVPPLAPPLALGGATLIEWNGAQRWCRCEPGVAAFDAAGAAGGHATLFRNGPSPGLGDVFAPLARPVMRLHRELKRAFDPAGILNPGRMYAEL